MDSSTAKTLRTFVPDLNGEMYTDVLRRMHSMLQPRSYLEIGCAAGNTLALAGGDVIAIDPDFALTQPVFAGKRALHMFQMTSDQFFGRYDPRQLFGQAIDLAFLDGMHLWEFLLRDFINTEKSCRRNSVVLMHDCIPVDIYIAERIDNPDRRLEVSTKPAWWAGDVWKTVVVLKKYRPDLAILAIDAAPTGLIAISNLDPASTVLDERYFEICRDFKNVELSTYGLERYFAECDIESTMNLRTPQDLARHFWI